MRCLWHLVYIDCSQTTRRPLAALQERESPMAKTAAIAYAPTGSLFARLVAAIDRALTASARASLAQRRPAALRALSLRIRRLPARGAWRAASRKVSSQRLDAPDFSGAFFVSHCAPVSLRTHPKVLRQIRRSDRMKRPVRCLLASQIPISPRRVVPAIRQTRMREVDYPSIPRMQHAILTCNALQIDWRLSDTSDDKPAKDRRRTIGRDCQ